jgi:4-amino-4-deoxy-L-arabinose transferase-like glycosyltransferase
MRRGAIPDLAFLAILALGLWLRWGLNGVWRLGPDEALYSTWARHIADGSDVWLAAIAGVDKPPLFIYLTALSMHFYGITEFATRFPAIISSAISIALTYVLSMQLYSSRTIARLAALALALSPFAILYAPTGYADPLLVMWLMLAVVLAGFDRWALAGAAAALAVLTKQEAPVLLPLALIIGLPLARRRRAPGSGKTAAWIGVRLLHFGLVCVALAAGVEMLWEAARPGQLSPFALGLAHYGGIGLVAAGDMAPRLAAWWDEALRYVFASPVLDALCLAGIPLVLLLGSRDRRQADISLVVACVYAVLVRTVIDFQLWNRYMLAAVPFLCILLARSTDLVWGGLTARAPSAARWRPLTRLLALVPLLVVGALLIGPVNDARAGRIPVGSDHGEYTGIDDAARFIRTSLPPGSVIYHSTLGWLFGYYLYGAHLDFWWYPSLTWLADTAAGRSEQSQYIVVPLQGDVAAIEQALGARGLGLIPAHTSRRTDGSVSFQTYRIAPDSEASPSP